MINPMTPADTMTSTVATIGQYSNPAPSSEGGGTSLARLSGPLAVSCKGENRVQSRGMGNSKDAVQPLTTVAGEGVEVGVGVEEAVHEAVGVGVEEGEGEG